MFGEVLVSSTVTADLTRADIERNILDWHDAWKTAVTDVQRQRAADCRDNWLELLDVPT